MGERLVGIGADRVWVPTVTRRRGTAENCLGLLDHRPLLTIGAISVETRAELPEGRRQRRRASPAATGGGIAARSEEGASAAGTAATVLDLSNRSTLHPAPPMSSAPQDVSSSAVGALDDDRGSAPPNWQVPIAPHGSALLVAPLAAPWWWDMVRPWLLPVPGSSQPGEPDAGPGDRRRRGRSRRRRRTADPVRDASPGQPPRRLGEQVAKPARGVIPNAVERAGGGSRRAACCSSWSRLEWPSRPPSGQDRSRWEPRPAARIGSNADAVVADGAA
jgi:hypothetical protein